MKLLKLKFIILFFTVIGLSNSMFGQCMGFSSYIEGSSNNKCFELYNGTAGAITFAAGQYELHILSDSGADINLNLNTTINSGNFFLICDPSAESNLCITADATSGSIGSNLNGDDAVYIVNAAIPDTIDMIGDFMGDPGTEWSNGSCGTANESLYKTNLNLCFDGNPVATADFETDPFALANYTCASINDVSGLNTGLPTADRYEFTIQPTFIVEGGSFNVEVCVTDGTCPEILYSVPDITVQELPPAPIGIVVGPPANLPATNGCAIFTVNVPGGTGGSCFELVSNNDATLTPDTSALICIGSLLPNGCLELNGDSIFINEIHYDNTGGDVAEGIEVAGPFGTDLSCYTLYFYNGADGNIITGLTTVLAGIVDNENLGPGYGTIWFPISGIQNGVPDGVVLYNNCNSYVLQFLSWEGSFLALYNVAAGITSTDIGVSEGSSTPIGSSLQLIDINATDCSFLGAQTPGNCPSEFVWAGPLIASPGDVNCVQILPQSLQQFTGTIVNDNVEINWVIDLNEIVGSFSLERSANGFDFETIASIPSMGTGIATYTYLDDVLINDLSYYKLNVLDDLGNILVTRTISIDANSSTDIKIFPIPAQDVVHIDLTRLDHSEKQLTIYNTYGSEVYSSVVSNGIEQLQLDHIPTGVYFMVISGHQARIKKRIVLK